MTVAVLPFADLGGKPENQYFSDGLTEELIHALTKVPGMRVVAWNTAAQLRDRQQDLHAIREQLQVGTVLTGSVRIAGRQSARARATDRYRVRRVPVVGDLRPPHAGRVRHSGRDRAGHRAHPAGATLGRRRRRAAGAQHAAASAPTITICAAATTGTGARRKIWRAASNISRPRSRPIHTRRWRTPAWPMRTRCWWTTAWSARPPECRRRKPRRCAPSNSTPRWARRMLHWR